LAVGRLAGRVAVVTGAGRGIGAATAELFASEGAAVVVNDVDAEPAEQTVARIVAAGGNAVVDTHDTVDPTGADALVATVVDAFGQLDVLVNNAGITRDRMFHVLDPAAFDLVLNVNLATAVNTTRAAMPLLRDVAKAEIARDGRPRHHRKITFTSSVAALTGNRGQANYTAAKGALVSLTKTLALELGGFSINVNAVAPGFIETRLTAAKTADGDLGIPEAQREAIKAMISLGRLGEPADVAKVHLFLASSDADFVSGVTVPVTGGQFGGMG
jgi:3-oxoacyl-[acyl-carrier protein] reductase